MLTRLLEVVLAFLSACFGTSSLSGKVKHYLQSAKSCPRYHTCRHADRKIGVAFSLAVNTHDSKQGLQGPPRRFHFGRRSELRQIAQILDHSSPLGRWRIPVVKYDSRPGYRGLLAAEGPVAKFSFVVDVAAWCN